MECRRMVRRVAIAGFVLWFGVGCGSPFQRGPLPCSVDSDCALGEYCGDDSRCRYECRQDRPADCAATEACNARGRCVLDVPGECSRDSDCDAPPNPGCAGDTALTYEPEGTCQVAGTRTLCVYQTVRNACRFGCEDGACSGNPCDGNACSTPPRAACSDDGASLVTFRPDGVCRPDDGGTCDFRPAEVSCAFGCIDGSCRSGPCDGLVCDTPPEPTCEEGVAVSYSNMGQCVDDQKGTRCTYEPAYLDCTYVDGRCQEGRCVDGVEQVGPLVITEWMANPTERADSEAEWIEIFNSTGQTVSLRGWRLGSGGNGTVPLDPDASVSAGGYAVLEASEDYDGIHLANGSDSVWLETPSGDASDYVYYEQGTVLGGSSRALNPDVEPSPTANDAAGVWCPTLDPGESYAGEDRGTPGQENAACAERPCEHVMCHTPPASCRDGVARHPTKVPAECSTNRLNNPVCDAGVEEVECGSDALCIDGYCESLPGNAPGPGDLIFTEVMGNPSAVSDSRGEWVEVYNTTGGRLSLAGLLFEDNETGRFHDSYRIDDASASIDPGGYAVLAVDVDPASNGGVAGATRFDGSHLKNSPPDGMTIKLVRWDDTLVDSAPYPTPVSGVALQRDPSAPNDSVSNWCLASRVYGDGDLGTPGAANDPCGP